MQLARYDVTIDEDILELLVPETCSSDECSAALVSEDDEGLRTDVS